MLAIAASGQVDTDASRLTGPPFGVLGCRPSELAKSAGGDDKNRLRREESEWIKGSELAASAESRTTLIDDPDVYQYLNQLERRIISDSQLDGCFVVKVLKDTEFNAYSYPGGFIYVTSTLFISAQNEDQLAAVLAHETAHVVARHVTTLDHQKRNWGRVVRFAGPVGFPLRRYLGPLLTMKVLREQESEADLLGLQYYIASGYDPAEFVKVLQIAFPDGEAPERFFERMYYSHPPIKMRIQHLQSASRELHSSTLGSRTEEGRLVQLQAQLQKSIEKK